MARISLCTLHSAWPRKEEEEGGEKRGTNSHICCIRASTCGKEREIDLSAHRDDKVNRDGEGEGEKRRSHSMFKEGGTVTRQKTKLQCIKEKQKQPLVLV